MGDVLAYRPDLHWNQLLPDLERQGLLKHMMFFERSYAAYPYHELCIFSICLAPFLLLLTIYDWKRMSYAAGGNTPDKGGRGDFADR